MPASPLFLSFAIVAVGLVAGAIPFFLSWSHQTAHRWIAFGAGAILGAAFIHMIPEAWELSGARGFGFVILGFLALFLLEQISFRHPHDEETGEFHEIGFLAFLGITFHDLIDGLALGSGEHVPELEPAIFAALILHKIPTTFAASLLMLHGGMPRKKILAYLAILLMAIPVGVLIATFTIRQAGPGSEMLIGMLINFSAGTFIYIAAYELLPEMQRKSGPGSKIGLFFILGLAAMFVLKLIHPVA